MGSDRRNAKRICLPDLRVYAFYRLRFVVDIPAGRKYEDKSVCIANVWYNWQMWMTLTNINDKNPLFQQSER
ncbi:hypothetical protein ACN42_g7642 [Penicillium freii]|uniref:Uncharacterized protein n=1 Tax=Penicillium freii TaxID=48697 RepID=A0A117NMN0_PENFR|nr:hypothetical protein ACN42_g7642 [Penicillium freii]